MTSSISLRLTLAILCAAALLPAAFAQPPSALSPAAVSLLAGTCLNCHGPGGRSPGASAIPSIGGQPRAHLLARLQAFQAGTAADATVMTRLMKGYDDAQIQALAGWFAQEGKP